MTVILPWSNKCMDFFVFRLGLSPQLPVNHCYCCWLLCPLIRALCRVTCCLSLCSSWCLWDRTPDFFDNKLLFLARKGLKEKESLRYKKKALCLLLLLDCLLLLHWWPIRYFILSEAALQSTKQKRDENSVRLHSLVHRIKAKRRVRGECF